MVCPVDYTKVDDKIVRIVAFLVLIISIIGIVTRNEWLFLFLVLDFGLRAFADFATYSVLRRIAVFFASIAKLTPQLVGGAPKRFAAKVGIAFSLSIFILLLLNLPYTAAALTLVLCICAFLESAFAYCVGCKCYSLYYEVKARL